MIETGRRAKSVSLVNKMVKVVGPMFVPPESLALGRLFPTFQNQLLCYLAYPTQTFIVLPEIPKQIKVSCSQAAFPLLKAQVRQGRGQTRNHK
jgi:hypothetical protein